MASFLHCLSFSDCQITSMLNSERKEASAVWMENLGGLRGVKFAWPKLRGGKGGV